jgi:hypothetical protein
MPRTESALGALCHQPDGGRLHVTQRHPELECLAAHSEQDGVAQGATGVERVRGITRFLAGLRACRPDVLLCRLPNTAQTAGPVL